MKLIILLIIFLPLAAVYLLPGEDTIKPSKEKKAIKSQGLLLGALAILGIF